MLHKSIKMEHIQEADIGFKGGTTKVSVTIADGKITNIETLSYGDDRKYYERAQGSVIKGIISTQSTSVDTVSGATFSSKGIISAVKDALNQACNSSSSSDTSNDNSGTKEESVTSNAAENTKNTTSDSKVNQGSASSSPSSSSNTSNNNSGTKSATTTSDTVVTPHQLQKQIKELQVLIQQVVVKVLTKMEHIQEVVTGFKGGTTKVSVTVANGKITGIETLSNGDTPQYYKRASGTVTSNIISKQSTSVDTVSGATYSSKGIMSAVANALSQAK